MPADYSLAQWLPSPNFWAGGDGNKYIVVHATASGGPQTGYQLATGSEFTDGKTASVHYINDVDGTVYQIVREADSAWGNCCATGTSLFDHSYNYNKNTISIENVKHSSDNSEPLTAAQYQSLLALIRDICARQGIPMQPGTPTLPGIIFHHDLDPVTRAGCPGTFPYDTFMSDLKGGSVSTTLTASGEVAEFISNVDQLEAGESPDECVAFAASMIWHSTQPGTPNSYVAEDVDQMADYWYPYETGSITSTSGMSLPQLHDMLNGMGLKYQDIPSTPDAIRSALKSGYPVIITALESSMYDVQLGRVPYGWDPGTWNHAIVATGLPDLSVYPNGVWVRDTVEVGQTFPPASKRMYDLSKMKFASCVAVIPSWLSGGTSMPVPSGWKDDGTTLTAPNGLPVRFGFRTHVISAPAWESADWPLQTEVARDPIEESNPARGHGSRQIFRKHLLEYTSVYGVYEGFIGQEFLYVLNDRDAKAAALSTAQAALSSAQKQVSDLQTQVAQLQASAGSAPANLPDIKAKLDQLATDVAAAAQKSASQLADIESELSSDLPK